MTKIVAYSADYSRTNLASKITWCLKNPKITDCEPFIDFIRCDDGNDYHFLHSDSGDIQNQSLFMFEAIYDKSDGNYFLCYSADFELELSTANKRFFDALKKSKNQVEIVLGFRDTRGAELSGCFEEYENRTVTLEKT